MKIPVKNYVRLTPLVEDTSEKLRCILRSHKIRSTFYTENTLRKLLCKPKDWVAREDKNNIAYEIDCSNGEAVYFGESKWSLKSRSDEHKRSVRNCDCDKNDTAGKQITTLTGIRHCATSSYPKVLLFPSRSAYCL